ncbi:MAG: ABC transporter ATP-binding protein [Planctomycetota bacterium]
MAELIVEHLSKEYVTRAEPLVILRDVNVRVTAGQSVAIVGPSGSGKSTLLQILGTLDQPTSGQVRIDGRDPFSLADLQLAQFRNRTFGFVFQEHHLLPQLTVLENVLVPALASGTPTREQQNRAQELLARVGLRERLHHRPAELSGGERQRVALARALLLKPPILLADEPTGNLDRTNAQAVGRLLGELQQAEKMTLIVVTHSAELASLMGRQMTINEGKLV